jgi:predicted RND superfamily exporter protein
LAARLAAASVGRPRTVVAGSFLAAAVLLAGATRMPSEVGYAAYFGPRSPEVEHLTSFLQEFESGFHVLIAFGCRETSRCERVDEPWALDFLARLHEAADRLPNVRRTWSALNTPVVVAPLDARTLATPEADRGLRLDPEWPALLARGLDQRGFGGTVIATDARAAAVVIELRSIESEAMRATVRGALALVTRFEPELGTEIHLAGEPVWTVVSADSLERDSRRLTALMFAAMFALLLALFRDPWLTVLPLLAVGLVTIAVQGAGGALGLPNTSLLAALPPLLVAIAIAGSIHLLAAVARAAGTAPPELVLARAAREVGDGCFWSALTTAAGFATFLGSDLASFRHFGALAAGGVVAAFVVTFTVLPALLCLRMRRAPLRSRPAGAALAREVLGAVFDTVTRYPRFVLLASFAVFALLAAGGSRLRYASDFGFGENSFVVRSLRVIEASLRKPMTTEVLVELPPGRHVWEEPTLRLLARIESVFAAEPSTGDTWSFLDLLEEAHRADLGRPPASLDEIVAAARRETALVAASERARWFWSEREPSERTRISVDRAWLDDAAQSPYVARVRDALAAVERSPEAAGHRIELAGGLVLADRFVSQLRDTQRCSFLSAFVVVTGALALALRGAPRLLVRAAASNLLPVIALLGLMGWAGIGLDPASTMVGAILLALGDDHTIHLALHYRAKQREGLSAIAALESALTGVGTAVLTTGACLALGFSVLLFAEWRGLVHFGLVAAVGIGLLLASGLLFLPAFLLAMEPRRARVALAAP